MSKTNSWSVYHRLGKPERMNTIIREKQQCDSFQDVLVSHLQTFMSILNLPNTPDTLAVTEKCILMELRGPSVCHAIASTPSPAPSLLPSPPATQRTPSWDEATITKLIMRTRKLPLKFSVCLTPGATGLKAWRWNSFDPLHFFSSYYWFQAL